MTVTEKAEEREREDDKIREEIKGLKEEVGELKIEVGKMKGQEGKSKGVENEKREKKKEREWKEHEERLERELELVRRWERRRNLIIEGLEQNDRKDKAGIENWIKEGLEVELVIKRVKNIAGGKVLVECANCEEKEKMMSEKGKLKGS